MVNTIQKSRQAKRRKATSLQQYWRQFARFICSRFNSSINIYIRKYRVCDSFPTLDCRVENERNPTKPELEFAEGERMIRLFKCEIIHTGV